jgi:hypothetical protein
MSTNVCCQGKAYTIGGKDRPSEIAKWIQHARSQAGVPTIEDVDSWRESWVRWWISLQPVTRQGEKLLRVVEADELWVETKKGTINGFYNIVVSLGWWLKALKIESDRTNFNSILDDVLWVAREMVPNLNQSTKRTRTNSVTSDSEGREKPPSKRYAFSLCNPFFFLTCAT